MTHVVFVILFDTFIFEFVIEDFDNCFWSVWNIFGSNKRLDAFRLLMDNILVFII